MVRATEVHRNAAASPPGGPHRWTPHDHQVWVCDFAPDPGALSAQWAAVTGGSPEVDVEEFHAYAHGLEPAALEAALAADAYRVFRYARKHEWMPPDARWARYAALTGAGASRSPRLTAAYGCLRGPAPDAPGPPAAGGPDAPARVFDRDGGGYRERE